MRKKIVLCKIFVELRAFDGTVLPSEGEDAVNEKKKRHTDKTVGGPTLGGHGSGRGRGFHGNSLDKTIFNNKQGGSGWGAGCPLGGEPAGATAAATMKRRRGPRRLFVEKKNQLLEFDATGSGKFEKKGTIRSFALSEDSWEEEVFNNIAIASG